ncbi:MAG: hypothetical protein IR164_17280 [Devosia sp.]|jgi:hypothetical protein|uniref:hypothetical protein n=1 Tax=unclassified Devosia TaxID=196773 RepID=UPI0019E8D098|nr:MULTISPECIES: hypothetical protein [unclassified Devosia]MBF0680680.1 hypothetical protein [Devosia sp.]WEJ32025.1 hypothetical protein NYQ88_14070 [Devosia sp. SD17-2]
MIRKLTLALGLIVVALQPALAACPPPPAGSTAEEIRAHGERLLCIQQQLAQDAERQKFQTDIEALNRSILDLQLQNKWNALPRPETMFPAVVLP